MTIHRSSLLSILLLRTEVKVCVRHLGGAILDILWCHGVSMGKNWIHSFNLFYIPCLNSNVFTLHVTQYSRWWHPGRTLSYFLYTAIENNKKEWHDTTWLWRQQKNRSSPLLANTFDIKCFDRTETSAQLMWHKRIEMKEIFAVVKQLEQLQRKPRKKSWGFNGIWSIFFWAFLLHNYKDHLHFYSLSAVLIYDLYYMHISSQVVVVFLGRRVGIGSWTGVPDVLLFAWTNSSTVLLSLCQSSSKDFCPITGHSNVTIRMYLSKAFIWLVTPLVLV